MKRYNGIRPPSIVGILRGLTAAALTRWQAECQPGGTLYPYIAAEVARRAKGH